LVVETHTSSISFRFRKNIFELTPEELSKVWDKIEAFCDKCNGNCVVRTSKRYGYTVLEVLCEEKPIIIDES